MRLYKQPTAAQAEKIRKNWARLQRWGTVRFVLLGGLVMFAWMTLCWAGFTYFSRARPVLHMPFIWEATLPYIAVMAFFLPASYYWMVRLWARRIDA